MTSFETGRMILRTTIFEIDFLRLDVNFIDIELLYYNTKKKKKNVFSHEFIRLG